jgi:hypothetical protein
MKDDGQQQWGKCIAVGQLYHMLLRGGVTVVVPKIEIKTKQSLLVVCVWHM